MLNWRDSKYIFCSLSTTRWTQPPGCIAGLADSPGSSTVSHTELVLTETQQTAAKPEEEAAEQEKDIPEETPTYGLGINSAWHKCRLKKKKEEEIQITRSCSVLNCAVVSEFCDPRYLPGSSVHGDSPGKNTGVGCHALLQGIFPTQGLNAVSCMAGRFFTVWATREAQDFYHQDSGDRNGAHSGS